MRTITELWLQNILRIKAVKIRPDGKVVKIAGKNAQGKSSILDGILMVLRGPRAYPDKPILDGADDGAGRIDLGDIVVTRDIGNGRLVVEDKQSGEKIRRPQEFLDSLLSKYTFDPLALLKMSPQEQAEEVKRILGIDFSDLDARYEELYEQRRIKTRDLKAAETYLQNAPGDPNGETQEVSIQNLMDRYNEMLQENLHRDELRAKLASLRDKYENINSKIDENTKKINEMKKMIERMEAENSRLSLELNQTSLEGKRIRDALSEGEDYNLDSIRKAINDVELKNKKIRDNIEAKRIKDQVDTLRQELAGIKQEIKAINDAKKERLSNSDIPIKGLEITDEGLLYNGLPLSQASQSEQIRIGFSLAIADSPDVSVVLVKEASLLDEDSLSEVAKLAEEVGFQVWLERVGNDPAAFIIEDGEVAREPIAKE